MHDVFHMLGIECDSHHLNTLSKWDRNLHAMLCVGEFNTKKEELKVGREFRILPIEKVTKNPFSQHTTGGNNFSQEDFFSLRLVISFFGEVRELTLLEKINKQNEETVNILNNRIIDAMLLLRRDPSTSSYNSQFSHDQQQRKRRHKNIATNRRTWHFININESEKIRKFYLFKLCHLNSVYTQVRGFITSSHFRGLFSNMRRWGKTRNFLINIQDFQQHLITKWILNKQNQVF